jgi:hypothetical protein
MSVLRDYGTRVSRKRTLGYIADESLTPKAS